MKIRIIFYTIFFCLIAIKMQAQKTICNLSKVNSDGFYAIPVSPQLSSFYTNDNADIRVLDSKNQQVPFVVRQKGIIKNSHTLIDLPIIKNNIDSNKTILIFQNNNSFRTLSSLYLQIKNNSVDRTAQLNGSNSLSNEWFAVAENILLNGKENINTTSYLQTISFPTNNYKYLQLVISNAKNKPLLIEKAFTDSSTLIPSKEALLKENPTCKFLQNDSASFSTITIANDSAFQVNALQITNDKTSYILRTAKVFDRNILLGNFTITSNIELAFLSSTKAKQLKIVIENGDNPPLKITDIKTFIHNKEIVAFLNKKENYRLQFQNGSTIVPSYDLAKFVDSIPLQLPTLCVTSFQNILEEKVVAKPNNKIWMWLAIAAVAGILGLLTYKLTKEVA